MQATNETKEHIVAQLMKAATCVHKGDTRYGKLADIFIGGLRLSSQIIHEAIFELEIHLKISEYEAMNLVLSITGPRCPFCNEFCRMGGVSGLSCAEATFHPYSPQEGIIKMMLLRVPTQNLAKTK